MTTHAEMMRQALIKLGVVDLSDKATNDQIKTCMSEFRGIVAQWNQEGLLSKNKVTLAKTLTSRQSVFSISAADVDGAPPDFLNDPPVRIGTVSIAYSDYGEPYDLLAVNYADLQSRKDGGGDNNSIEPSAYFVERPSDSVTLIRLDNALDARYTITIHAVEGIDDDIPSDEDILNNDAPKVTYDELYQRAFIYAVAVAVSSSFQIYDILPQMMMELKQAKAAIRKRNSPPPSTEIPKIMRLRPGRNNIGWGSRRRW